MAGGMMTHAVIQQLLDGIEQRERELAGQTGELAARMREADAEREALATTTTTVRAMAADLDSNSHRSRYCRTARPTSRSWVFSRPLGARDLCLALDLPVLPKHVEGTRAKLKRLVSLGFLDEAEPGSFARPHPPASSRDPSPESEP